MKLAMVAVILLAACPAPGSSTWGAGSGSTVAQGAPAAPGASCRATLECYGSCGLTEECLQGCDQRAGAEDVALAHASMTCIADSGCEADQDCVVQRCGSELSACTEIAIAPSAPVGSPAGGATGAAGALDLVYAVPSGWTEQRGADAITLAWAFADSYNHISYTLVILPSQPLRGSLTDTFLALWPELVTPLFTSAYTPGIQPAPIRRRLASGYAVAFDGELMNAKNGGMFTTVLYVLSSGDRVVPILGMFGELDAAKGEPIISAFFESASISGAPPTSAALFDASELVGEWSTQASEFANYVDSSGHYVGDATIAVRQDHTFGADGSYQAYASSFQSGRGFDREFPKGSWRLDDDAVVLDTDGNARRYRIFAVGTYRGVRSIYLPPSYAPTSVAELTRPRSLGDWFGKVK